MMMRLAQEKYLRRVGGALLMAALVGAVAFFPRAAQVKNTASALVLQPKVVLDPGHGGMDGGATAGEQAIEKGINLQIALKLRDLLQAGGFHVIMTREDDRSLHSDAAKTIHEQKSEDLKARLQLMQENADGIFVSIHQNSYPQASSWGAQVFYGPQDEDSRLLAQLLQQQLCSRLQPENDRQIKQAQSNLFLMYQAQSPAVLVECGFLTNPPEREKLCDPAYQDQLALAIFSAICMYYYPEQGSGV